MMLRNQKERMDATRIPDDASFFKSFGLTRARLDLAGPQALVMHPVPMNRNVEIADDVADDPSRSLILKQVANGIPVRMAVLDALLLQ
jgi:aspartate carbamoyltransferase catalytic subunit